MSIRNREAYAAAAWDWDIVCKGCFSAGSPSDIDGVYERNGHVLFIEAKGPGQSLPMGQRILLEALARKPDVTVLAVRGPKNDPREMRRFDPELNRLTGWEPTNLEMFQYQCRAWYWLADSKAARAVNAGNR